MTLENWKDVATIAGVIVSAAAAAGAFWIYRGNSRVERAKWIERLYEKFYESDKLRGTRDLIDCEATDTVFLARLDKMLDDETAEFNDYLNFFEFVAILEYNKQLKMKELNDMFGYYLRCLHENMRIREYIQNEAKGFEKLRALLAKIFSEK